MVVDINISRSCRFFWWRHTLIFIGNNNAYKIVGTSYHKETRNQKLGWGWWSDEKSYKDYPRCYACPKIKSLRGIAVALYYPMAEPIPPFLCSLCDGGWVTGQWSAQKVAEVYNSRSLEVNYWLRIDSGCSRLYGLPVVRRISSLTWPRNSSLIASHPFCWDQGRPNFLTGLMDPLAISLSEQNWSPQWDRTPES